MLVEFGADHNNLATLDGSEAEISMTLRELLEEGGLYDEPVLVDPHEGLAKAAIMDDLVVSAAEVMDRATHDRLMLALMKVQSSRF